MRRCDFIQMVLLNKNIALAAFIISLAALSLFFLMGLVLALFFLQNTTSGFKGIGLMQILFFLAGIYFVYKPAMNIKFLVENRKNFHSILDHFFVKNKLALIITSILSIILLTVFYSGLYLNINFFVNAVIFLPIFILNNLLFIVNIFLLRFKLTFLTLAMDIILPMSEVVYIFAVSKLIVKLAQK
jgi:hypothetical protein